MCKQEIILITKNKQYNEKEKELQYSLPDIFMEAQPPVTARQPPTWRGNPYCRKEEED